MTDHGHGDGRTAGEVLSGVDTLVRLLLLRHELDRRDGLTTATMVSGYPGSPLGTLDLALEQVAGELSAHAVVHRPGLNEELAAATVWGSQMGAVVPYAGVDGVVGAWYGKTPGLDRCGDALKHANAMGAGPGGGVVMFCGDDPTAKSSTLTCDSQHAFEDACVPVLVPGNQQEVLDLGVHAFRLSRWAGPWVGMKIVTAVADGVSTVELDPDRHHPEDPPDAQVGGRRWRHEPLATIGPHTVSDQEVLVVEHRLRAARAYVRHNGLDRVVGAGPGARLGIVCAGTTYHDVVQALADLGVTVDGLVGAGVRILKPAMTFPLVEQTVVEFASSVREVLVIEEKRPFVEVQLRSILHEAGVPTPVSGKRDRAGDPLVGMVGDLHAGDVVAVLTRVLPDLAPQRAASAGSTSPDSTLPDSSSRHSGRPAPARALLPVLELPGRPPAFCSGCPHNRSTVVPRGALVGGGVGCHGIMYFEARHQGERKIPPTPMGAEGVPWIGLSPFVDERHLIQNIGDGTLSHSGVLAIRACVAAGVDITFKVLYNSAVAMTGGQEVTGLMDVPALTRALEAEGVARIVVCADDPHRYGRRPRWAPGVEVHGRDDLEAVQEDLRSTPGVSVIVYDQQCAAEARRLRKRGLQPTPPRHVVINEAVCEGCGDCSAKSNCLSVVPVGTEFGEKRAVHDPSCNRDYTCLDGDCPSFVTLAPARRGRRRARAALQARPRLPAGALPVPDTPPPEGQWGAYLTGIGGTGVVTAARIIAAAAESAGLVVGGMDQTGLSQKAGAVVSHLHVAPSADALGAAVISAGGADLYLSGDILQAAAAHHLAKARPGRTLAVVDTSVTPTAAMLQGGATAPASERMQAQVAAAVGDDRVAFVDSRRIAEVAFADDLLANVVLLGVAYQRGGLPFRLACIEAAFARQGRSAERNREAFEWGRWQAHDPEAVQAALGRAVRGEAGRPGPFDPSPDALEQAAALVAGRRLPASAASRLTRRTAQVVDYQDAALARRFLDLVERSAVVEAASGGASTDLTDAVAESWFKLLTYKDEYEVARLHLATDYDHVASELGIEGAYSLRYHLHPPVLRRLGMSGKLPMGRPYELAFGVLARMKRLRGTRLDPFGRDRDRRTERALIEEYEGLMGDALDAAARIAAGHGAASGPALDELVSLARSPMDIRGYAEVKDAAVARWRDRVGAPAGRTRSTGGSRR